MTFRDFRLADHLPNRRPGGQPPSPEELPRQRNGVTPQMHGRYPDYNVLEEAAHWDEVTRREVMNRVASTPPIRFFAAAEAITLGVFCDRVMAQDRDPKIPVLNLVDAKLFAGQLDGFIFDGMPDDRTTWRGVAVGLNAAARQHRAQDFHSASDQVQHDVIDAFSTGALHGDVWDELPCRSAWSVVMRSVLSAFYSHPWAWNEIGFGGPAYPRGYARFGAGQRERWEAVAAFERDAAADVTARRPEGA